MDLGVFLLVLALVLVIVAALTVYDILFLIAAVCAAVGVLLLATHRRV